MLQICHMIDDTSSSNLFTCVRQMLHPACGSPTSGTYCLQPEDSHCCSLVMCSKDSASLAEAVNLHVGDPPVLHTPWAAAATPKWLDDDDDAFADDDDAFADGVRHRSISIEPCSRAMPERLPRCPQAGRSSHRTNSCMRSVGINFPQIATDSLCVCTHRTVTLT